MKNILFSLAVISFLFNRANAQKIEIICEGNTVKLSQTVDKKQRVSEYHALYPCVASKDLVIAEGKQNHLVNLSSGSFIELSEYYFDFRLENDSCRLVKGDIIRYREKGKTGLMKFPDSILLSATFNKIYPKARENDLFILVKGKKLQLYEPSKNQFSPVFGMTPFTELFIDDGYTYLPDNEIFIAELKGRLALVKQDGTWYMLDKSYHAGVDINSSGPSMILCEKDGKFGFTDSYANIIIPFRFDKVENLEYLYIVNINGKYGLIDDTGFERIPVVYDKIETDISELFRVTSDSKSILVDDFGNPWEVLEPVKENGKFGYNGIDKGFKIQCVYDSAKYFSHGLAPVCKQGKWGYIIPTGKVLIDFLFDDANSFIHYGMAAAKANGRWGVINRKGFFIVEALYDSIVPVNDGHFLLYTKTGVFKFDAGNRLSSVKINAEKGMYIDPRDKKIYKTIIMNNQEWFAQNLDYKTNHSVYYNNDKNNGILYGQLYTWTDALTACPAGWRLPSDEDWKTFEKNLGFSENELNTMGYNRGAAMTNLLKFGGESGFDIHMSGFLHGYDNHFYKLNEACIIWTSSPAGNEHAITRSFFLTSNNVGREDDISVKYALPVRCVRDSE